MVWQLHRLRPDSQPVSNAFLDLSKLELVAAPVTGKGLLQRLNYDDMQRIRKINAFLAKEGEIEGAISAALSGAQAPVTGKTKKRSPKMIDLGYDESGDAEARAALGPGGK